jgi:NADPH-dependent 2,4-dienoyl-CoA reductase/sulfur reductase-like enzyme
VREPGAAPDNYTMNHTAGMVLLDPRGRFLARFGYGMGAREIERAHPAPRSRPSSAERRLAMPDRRHFLASALALAAGPSLAQLAPRSAGRVLIIGGGWGGLAAASRCAQRAGSEVVTLVEREPAFRSLPLSNAWLVGLRAEPPRAAGRDGRRGRLPLSCVPRPPPSTAMQRRVHTTQGVLDYDWLILATGIRYDYAPWLGDDARAIEAVRREFPAGYVAGELDALKRKLADFAVASC